MAASPPRVRFSASTHFNDPLATSEDDGIQARRFDGIMKLSTPWDGLLQDTELWSRSDDCMVHFHARSLAHRPNLSIPLAALKHANNPYLLEKCLQRIDSPTTSDDGTSDSGYGGSISGEWAEKCYQLYIPAPSGLTVDEAINYHITTCNYFAYLLGRPIVGYSLGPALYGLWNRLQMWQSKETSRDGFYTYCQEQGYLSFTNNPEYALTALNVAERIRMRNIWLDAFVHCVGMSEVLTNCAEYDAISHTSRSLIMQTAAEMRERVQRHVRSICTFLEEDLGPECLGLSREARCHLDRFRSLLMRHYVGKVGYFPPGPADPWDRPLWTKLRRDFQYLYDYLADTESTSDWSNNRGLNGGVCVTQNILAFDARHDFTPLPHLLPLIPAAPARRRTIDTPMSLKSLRLSRSESQLDISLTIQGALVQATNTVDDATLNNPLIEIYVEFEKSKLEEKISSAEARKVRWILIYGTLQMLNNIMYVPEELDQSSATPYPLCVDLKSCPAWVDEVNEDINFKSNNNSSTSMLLATQTMEPDRISIRPDCDAENAEDYFNKTSISRTDSTLSLGGGPPPLQRVGSQLSRTASIRSSMNSLQKSVRGSLSRRNSLLRNPLTSQPSKKPSLRDLLATSVGSDTDSRPPASPLDNVYDPLDTALPNDDMVFAPYAHEGSRFNGMMEEPILEYEQLHHSMAHGIAIRNLQAHSPFGSHLSDTSSHDFISCSPSSRDGCDSPNLETSLWMADRTPRMSTATIVRVDPSLAAFDFGLEPLNESSSTVSFNEKPINSRTRSLPVNISSNGRPIVSVNAGCYVPSSGASRSRMPLSRARMTDYTGQSARVHHSTSTAAMRSMTINSVY